MAKPSGYYDPKTGLKRYYSDKYECPYVVVSAIAIATGIGGLGWMVYMVVTGGN